MSDAVGLPKHAMQTILDALGHLGKDAERAEFLEGFDKRFDAFYNEPSPAHQLALKQFVHEWAISVLLANRAARADAEDANYLGEPSNLEDSRKRLASLR